MYIPNYKKHRGWLRFFAGILIGALIGWGFFLAEYGQKHDHFHGELGKKRNPYKRFTSKKTLSL